jgi:hypothetical protein
MIALSLAGCGPLALYNHLYAPTGRHAPYRTHIIEFNDNGYMRSRDQLDSALAAMRLADTHHKVLTLLYVHGWNNNADVSNGDFQHFDAFAWRVQCDLNSLADSSRTRSVVPPENRCNAIVPDSTRETDPWEVVPIFIGWRGTSFAPEWWNAYVFGWLGQKVFTFWGRKASAERVGHGEFQVALGQISEQWLEWRTRPRVVKRENMLFLVGHSFGADLLLSAALPKMFRPANARVAMSYPSVADATIAINPAIEAAVLDQTALSPSAGLINDSRPTQLLLLDSDNDSARGFAFPVGRWLSTAMGTDDRSAETQAAGRPERQRPFALALKPHAPYTRSCGSPYVLPGDASDTLRVLSLNVDIPCTNSVMVIRTFDKLIDGHSGFWDPRGSEILRWFIARRIALQHILAR